MILKIPKTKSALMNLMDLNQMNELVMTRSGSAESREQQAQIVGLLERHRYRG